MGLLRIIFGKPKKRKHNTHSPKPKKLSESDIHRIKVKAEKNAAKYVEEWARKNPELARKVQVTC